MSWFKVSSAIRITCLLILGSVVADAKEEPVELFLYPHLKRSIGGVSEFKREQFITIHEAPIEEDWSYWENELEIAYGRDGGKRSGVRSRTPEDPNRKGFPDLNALRRMGRQYRKAYAASDYYRPKFTRETILCTHPEYYFAKAEQNHAPFGPKTYEAAAEFTAHYLKEFWTDESRPRYLEVFNEPFVHAEEIGATVEGFCEQHIAVARRVKELNPDVLVGGYTAAWVEVDARNFEHWNNWQKKFMDLAGEEMDFFSYHIYDGINVKGESRNRTGSNSEAILDLIDQYSYLLFGYAKPLVISEYGFIPEGNMGTMPYSSKRSADMLRSIMGQLMTFMDHPDRLIKTVPFILDKGLWTYGLKNEHIPGEANPFLLQRKLADGTFVKTDLIQFYKFWKGINGHWLYSRSDDPDLRCHFLSEKNTRHVILMNLEKTTREVRIRGLEELPADRVLLRSLRTDGMAPVIEESEYSQTPETLLLYPGQSLILSIESTRIDPPLATVEETRYHASDYLKPIIAHTPNYFAINHVNPGKGDAILRLSFGRDHRKNRKPEVFFNNQKLDVPDDWSGDNQNGRTNFFGMLEVPVPMEAIRESNQISVVFPDDGGKVSSTILQVNRVI
ncbi:MAG: beta-agarase [Coraliomargaritaceae bacterium]